MNTDKNKIIINAKEFQSIFRIVQNIIGFREREKKMEIDHLSYVMLIHLKSG